MLHKNIIIITLIIVGLFFYSCAQTAVTSDTPVESAESNDVALNGSFLASQDISMENTPSQISTNAAVSEVSTYIKEKAVELEYLTDEMGIELSDIFTENYPDNIDISQMDSYHEYLPDENADPALYHVLDDLGWGIGMATGATPIDDDVKKILKVYEDYENTTHALENAIEISGLIPDIWLLDVKSVALGFPYQDQRGNIAPGLDITMLYEYGLIRFDWFEENQIAGETLWFPIFIDFQDNFVKACHSAIYIEGEVTGVVAIHLDLSKLTENSINNYSENLMILSDDPVTNNFLTIGMNEGAKEVMGIDGYVARDWGPDQIVDKVYYVEEALNIEYDDKSEDLKELANKIRNNANHFTHTISGQKYHVYTESIPEFDIVVVGFDPIP